MLHTCAIPSAEEIGRKGLSLMGTLHTPLTEEHTAQKLRVAITVMGAVR